MNKNVFLLTKYSELLEEYVLSQKSKGLRFSYQKLAEQLNVQKSYLSKVLAGNANLNSDQFYLFTEILNLEGGELRFAELLLAKERCGNSLRKKKLLKEIDELKKSNLKTENALDIEDISDEKLNLYYLNPWAQIIHVALTIKKYRENPLNLKSLLSLEDSIFSETMRLLESLKLIKWQGKKISVLQESLHLSKSSPYFWAWRNQITQLGQLKSQGQSQTESYNFSVFFSADPEVKEEIHSAFLDYLKKVEKLVKKSNADNLYQMSFDLIPWL